MDFLKDDMIFVGYMDDGFQCIMKIKTGMISVRFGGRRLFSSIEKPYEVWYPDEDAPLGYQTAENIWNYIKNQS